MIDIAVALATVAIIYLAVKADRWRRDRKRARIVKLYGEPEIKELP
ncbi:hypothetical protein ACM66T_10050 [Sulfurimonas sp. ST-25]